MLLLLNFSKALQNFEAVSECPSNANSWKIKSDKKDCKGSTPDYLCAAIENHVGKYGEICTKYGLTPVYKCAVLNAQTYNLDSVDCKAITGCPKDPYIPSELWKYPICFKDFYGTKTTMAIGTTQTTVITDNVNRNATQNGHRSGNAGSGAGVALAVVIILIIVVVVLVVFYVRNQFGFKDKLNKSITDVGNRLECFQQRDDTMEYAPDVEAGVAEPDTKKPLLTGKQSNVNASNVDNDEKKQKIQKLLLYFVHILKREISPQELKEKIVMHSKSIEEHFSVHICKYIQSVQEVEDYGKLEDMSLVYMMLRNFCENIKPPNRGWDYEPSDNDTSTGADIERIRSMWNKYCDDDLHFKHLDDVYNRMKQNYGTVAMHEYEAGFDMVMEKIQSIKLNPDCTVKRGIVITEKITTALKILESRNVVILKGVIGCGKTHALKAIQTYFQGAAFVTEWMEENIKLQEAINKETPTIILCDNLFGRFGCSVFSHNEFIRTENVLKTVENSKHIKVAVAIHTHVYEEVELNKHLKGNFLHQKNITVDMDKLSEAETLLIFKTQQENGHCKKNSDCWFRKVGFQSVIGKLTKNQGQIGSPFLSMMYCNQHELFSEENFPVNPVTSLKQHFQKIEQGSSMLYASLVYLMCVQEHKCEEEPKKLDEETSSKISKETFNEMANTSGFIRVENNTASLAHEILTMVLFKFTAESNSRFLPVVKNCKVDFMLQILRPKNSFRCTLYCDFMDVSKKSEFKSAGKIFLDSLASNRALDVAHPLRSIKWVCKNCKTKK